MKAKFKWTKTACCLPLTIGKIYDVLEVKTDRERRKLREIKVKNDLGQERWYMVHNFELLAEAAAFVKKEGGSRHGEKAARSATPDGRQIYIGIDMAHGTDMAVYGKSLEMTDIEKIDAAAGLKAREGLEIGKAFAAGIADGIAETQNLNYGA